MGRIFGNSISPTSKTMRSREEKFCLVSYQSRSDHLKYLLMSYMVCWIDITAKMCRLFLQAYGLNFICYIKYMYICNICIYTEPGSLLVSASLCYATGSGFDLGGGQSWLSLSSLGWVDKMSNKFTWQLNTGDPAGIC